MSEGKSQRSHSRSKSPSTGHRARDRPWSPRKDHIILRPINASNLITEEFKQKQIKDLVESQFK